MKGWLVVATAAWVLGPMAEAAELKVIAGGSMTAPLNQLSAEFEKATGAPGVEPVGPFPDDLQQELVFTSAVAADTKEAGAAKALIDYLRTPAATAVIKATGMTPG